MAQVHSPRGTSDILPEAADMWQKVEHVTAQVMKAYGYGEIRTPVFEATELFQRGVGETTDIVEKQMYTFEDRGGRSLTLRPEGTAAVVRAYLQHNLYGRPLPQKFWYLQPMFRYERPQAGRGRQFHQFGAEALGSLDPACDVEMIAIPLGIFRRLGLQRFEVLVNSIGCPNCRPAYREVLLEYLSDRIDRLCSTCAHRAERNPLRVLDCKEASCQEATQDAPATKDHLCDECRQHFEVTLSYLDALEIPYRVDPRLVRGLDYYTKTVFEVVTDLLGAQDTLAAGGRYDGLAQELGGPPTPAVGFAAGMERVILALEKSGEAQDEKPRTDAFFVTIGEEARRQGIKLAHQLRRSDVAVEIDYRESHDKPRGMRGQLKAAARTRAPITLILGEDELARGVVAMKRMSDGSQRDVPFAELTAELQKEILL